MKRQSGALRRHLAALVLYTCLALLLTWPLVIQFSTHVTGDGIDDPALAWNLWWIKVRLVDQHALDIFHTKAMFFPIGINLAFYTLTPLQGLLSIPIQTSLQLVIANNILLLATFIIGAYGAYLLCIAVLSDWIRLRPAPAQFRRGSAALHTAALFGGIVYGFASSKIFYSSLGQFNICSSHWIPFFGFYLWRAIGRHPQATARRSLLLAGLFFTFQAWSELTYASFLLIFALLIFLWRLFQPRAAVARPVVQRFAGLARDMAVLAVPIGLGLLPILWAMVPDLLVEGDFFAHGGGFADIFSNDLIGFLVPTQLHPLFGTWSASLPFPNDKGQHIFLGYSVILLAGIAIFHWQSTPRTKTIVNFFAGSTLIFALLALGPNLRVLGRPTPLPGPFALVSLLPFFSGNRYPSRYSVMLMLCLAVLAAIGLYQWMINRQDNAPVEKSYRRQYGWGAMIAIVFLFEHLSVPVPLTSFRVPAIYHQIAGLSDAKVVLELPTGWRNGARVLGRADKLIMMQQWYQTVHGKPRLGGNTSRNPEHKFQYFTEAPLIGDMIAIMNEDRPHLENYLQANWPTLVQKNRSLAPSVLQFLGISHVVLHVDRSPPGLVKFVEQALPLSWLETYSGADWEGRPAETRLYQVSYPAEAEVSAPSVLDIDLTSPLADLILAEGWSASTQLPAQYRWVTRKYPVLYLGLDEQNSSLEFTLHPASKLAAVLVNGTSVPLNSSVQPDSLLATATVPGSLATEHLDRIELRFAEPLLAVADLLPTLPTGKDGRLQQVSGAVFVRSAGEEVGDFAHIYVNGIERAVGLRGYNVVAMDTTGAVLGSEHFDTFASPATAGALAAWIDQWNEDTVVAGAIADTAVSPDEYGLPPQVAGALTKLGVQEGLPVTFRASHAFIGYVGAQPGEAIESTTLLQPASVHLRAPLDAPTVAGAVSRIRISYP